MAHKVTFLNRVSGSVASFFLRHQLLLSLVCAVSVFILGLFTYWFIVFSGFFVSVQTIYAGF